MSSLADLFPDGDYRFHLTLRRGEPGDFFASRDATGALLAERAAWLESNPARYAALQPEAASVFDEFAALAAEWGVPDIKSVQDLGRMMEPDVLLLSPDATGQFRLRGGALCFPTGWSLEEKLGHTLDFIHGTVPGLNAVLAAPIHQLLAKLKPGVVFQRDNWSIAGTDELNLHVARGIPPPMPPVALDRLWLRIEHQALLALPSSQGIAFGIRIALHRLDAVAGGPAAAGLRGALATMPAAMVAYKRLDGVRDELVERLK